MTPIVTWQDRAACKDLGPDRFFFDEDDRGRNHDTCDRVEAARRMCAACPVSNECLAYANDKHIIDGMWGGLTRSQRAHARKSGHEAQHCPRCNRMYVRKLTEPVSVCEQCVRDVMMSETGVDRDEYLKMSYRDRANVRKQMKRTLNSLVLSAPRRGRW